MIGEVNIWLILGFHPFFLGTKFILRLRSSAIIKILTFNFLPSYCWAMSTVTSSIHFQYSLLFLILFFFLLIFQLIVILSLTFPLFFTFSSPYYVLYIYLNITFHLSLYLLLFFFFSYPPPFTINLQLYFPFYS